MATITVEGIPAGLLLRLAASAAVNGRCLNSEIIVHLTRAAHAGAVKAARPDHRDLAGRRGEDWGCPCRKMAGAGEQLSGWGGPASGGTEGRTRG
jgi:hypothetical protein